MSLPRYRKKNKNMFRILISVDPTQWQTQKGRSILEQIILLPYMYMIRISLSLSLSLKDPLGVTIRLGVICERERERKRDKMSSVILLQGLG